MGRLAAQKTTLQGLSELPVEQRSRSQIAQISYEIDNIRELRKLPDTEVIYTAMRPEETEDLANLIQNTIQRANDGEVSQDELDLLSSRIDMLPKATQQHLEDLLDRYAEADDKFHENIEQINREQKVAADPDSIAEPPAHPIPTPPKVRFVAIPPKRQPPRPPKETSFQHTPDEQLTEEEERKKYIEARFAKHPDAKGLQRLEAPDENAVTEVLAGFNRPNIFLSELVPLLFKGKRFIHPETFADVHKVISSLRKEGVLTKIDKGQYAINRNIVGQLPPKEDQTIKDHSAETPMTLDEKLKALNIYGSSNVVRGRVDSENRRTARTGSRRRK